MFGYFSAASTTDPATSILGYYFTQGVLGITVVVLALVVRFMFKYYTDKLDIKDAKIDSLQQARLEDNKTHANDYRDMARNDQIVLSGNSQANELLAAKIEAVKSQG